MYRQLYLEINLFCIVILGIILYKLRLGVDATIGKRIYGAVLLNAILLFAYDCLWMVAGDFMPRLLNTVINALYMLQTGVLGFVWLLYSEYTKNPLVWLKKKHFIKYAVFPVILIILSLASIKTGWLFYIDENQVYHRGDLYILQPILAYALVVVDGITDVYMAKREPNYIKKLEYITLSSFIVLPLICGGIQIMFRGIPLLCCGITLSLLIIFLTMQERQISLDALTQLNNRNYLNRYLTGKLSEKSKGGRMHLILMDIDYFKQINDTYGHIEGDKALVRLAGALKEACGSRNCFVARYGGDEFVVIYDENSMTGDTSIKDRIRECLNEANVRADTEYTISVSMGETVYNGEKDMTIHQFIAAADKELYEIKKNRKK